MAEKSEYMYESLATTIKFAEQKVRSGDLEDEFGLYTEVNLSRKLEVVHLEEPGDTKRNRPIVITGFGSLYPIGNPPPKNRSSTIIHQFYYSHGGKFSYRDETIDIVTGPSDVPPTTPIDSSYHRLNEDTFNEWLARSDARLYLHLGVKTNGDMNTNPLDFENWAHNIPIDPVTGDFICWKTDYRRNSNDGKPCVQDGNECLSTSFDTTCLIEKVWRKIDGQIGPVFLRESFNAGNFLCNFLYYRSLFHASKRHKANVLFIHVPSMLYNGVTDSDLVWVLGHIVRVMLDMLSQQSDDQPGYDFLYRDPGLIGHCENPMPYAYVDLRKKKLPRGTIRYQPVSEKLDRYRETDVIGCDEFEKQDKLYAYPDKSKHKAFPSDDKIKQEVKPLPRGGVSDEQGVVYAEIEHKVRPLPRGGVSDEQGVVYAEIEHKVRPLPRGGVSDEQHVTYAEIKHEVVRPVPRGGVSESSEDEAVAGKSVQGQRMKHTHTLKKQTRNSRRRRRQKRNARQRKHK